MNDRIWDFWAPHYDSLWVQRISLGPTRRALLAGIGTRPGMSLLDMGCGTGQLLGDLKRHFGSARFGYVGVDQSPRMIAVARAKYPDATFTIGCSAGYTAADSTFDVVICAHSFPYFPDKPAMLRKLRNMLKPGGILLIAQACTDNLYDAVVLALVKLSTSAAQYPGRRRMRAMAAPVFDSMPQETRIGPGLLVPSIYVFKWTREDGGGA